MWSLNKEKNIEKDLTKNNKSPIHTAITKNFIIYSQKNDMSNLLIENDLLHSNKIKHQKIIRIDQKGKETDQKQIVKVHIEASDKINSENSKKIAELSIGSLKKHRDKIISNLKRHRPRMSQKKRKVILEKDPWIKKLFQCRSKSNLISIFLKLPEIYKEFIKIYLEKCFLLHLHLRQIKNLFQLMEHRQCIYNAIDDPQILLGNMKFKNNMVKNFAKGVVNFIVLFYEDLKRIHLLPTKKPIKISSD